MGLSRFNPTSICFQFLLCACNANLPPQNSFCHLHRVISGHLFLALHSTSQIRVYTRDASRPLSMTHLRLFFSLLSALFLTPMFISASFFPFVFFWVQLLYRQLSLPSSLLSTSEWPVHPDFFSSNVTCLNATTPFTTCHSSRTTSHILCLSIRATTTTRHHTTVDFSSAKAGDIA